MNTEQFIRESASRGLSRRATMQALGLGRWKFSQILSVMEPIKWPAKGQSLDHRRSNAHKRGHCPPALNQALQRARQARKQQHSHTVCGQTGTIEELVDLLQSPVSVSTVRRRVAGGMSVADALTTPRLPSKPPRARPFEGAGV